MTAPATNLVRHEADLADARAAYKAGVPLSAEGIDALVREISFTRAECELTRAINIRTAAVLDAFATVGLKLERVEPSVWAVQTEKGWTRGVTPWDALQKATRIESVAAQLTQFANRLSGETG